MGALEWPERGGLGTSGLCPIDRLLCLPLEDLEPADTLAVMSSQHITGQFCIPPKFKTTFHRGA